MDFKNGVKDIQAECYKGYMLPPRPDEISKSWHSIAAPVLYLLPNVQFSYTTVPKFTEYIFAVHLVIFKRPYYTPAARFTMH